MGIPDLTPAERADLRHLLAEQNDTPTIPYERRMPPAESAGEPDAGSTKQEAVEDDNILYLMSGAGAWKGHTFLMTEARLRKVHELIAKCIATDLRAEIKRIRGA